MKETGRKKEKLQLKPRRKKHGLKVKETRNIYKAIYLILLILTLLLLEEKKPRRKKKICWPNLAWEKKILLTNRGVIDVGSDLGCA